MSRLAALLRWDLLFQVRYGILWAIGILTLAWLAMLSMVDVCAQQTIIPLALFFDLGVAGAFFIGAMVLFEKGDQTLDALILTPVSFGEYIFSKAATLTFLSTAACIIVACGSYQMDFNIALLILGIIFESVVFILIGFIIVAHYDSVTSYLIPASGYFTILMLPGIDVVCQIYEINWAHWAFYALPGQAPFVIIRASFSKTDPLEIIGAAALCVGWIIAAYFWAARVFKKQIKGGN